MHPTFVIILIVCLAGLGAFVLLMRSLSQPTGPVAPAILAGQFSRERYAPLASLLTSDEYEFLRQQPGFTAAVGRRFRAERRAICRQYLRLLKADFAAVYSEASRILLYSKQDRPELARALFEQRLRFAAGLVRAEILLALHHVRAEDVRLDQLLTPVAELQRALESAVLSGATA